MRACYLILFVFIISCNSKPIPKEASDRSKIIEYLKSEYRIKPEPNRFDSNYTRSLIENHKSLEPDSLINSHLQVLYYKPLNLSFIRYHNRFGYKDAHDDSDMHYIFEINLLKDHNTGKFYLDWINDYANYSSVDFCSWTSLSDELGDSIKKKLTSQEVANYEKVKISRRYSKYEFATASPHKGIESYLNDTYRFKCPSDEVINNLNRFYDSAVIFRRDIPLELPDGLYKYFSEKYNEIRNREYYTMDELKYLKEQINFLLIKANSYHGYQKNKYLWIFVSGYQLRVRQLFIKGNETSGFSYFINEYEICF